MTILLFCYDVLWNIRSFSNIEAYIVNLVSNSYSLYMSITFLKCDPCRSTRTFLTASVTYDFYAIANIFPENNSLLSGPYHSRQILSTVRHNIHKLHSFLALLIRSAHKFTKKMFTNIHKTGSPLNIFLVVRMSTYLLHQIRNRFLFP